MGIFCLSRDVQLKSGQYNFVERERETDRQRERERERERKGEERETETVCNKAVDNKSQSV